MIPIAAIGVFTFVSMTLLVAMVLAVLRISFVASLALPVTRIGQSSRWARDQCKTDNSGNQ
jgi:hypothetical protein